jgi:fatty-acid desaturase
MNLRHRESWNFAYLLFGGVLLLSLPSLTVVAVSYFVFSLFGISVGLHRVAGHGAALYKPVERVCFVLGLLTHAGPLKGSALHHARHHLYADTSREYEPFRTALTLTEARAVLGRFDRFANWLDRDYYYWFFTAWFVLVAIEPGIFIGAALANFVHLVAAELAHLPGIGYRRYDTPDNSQNIWWLWPLTYGDNWHNNHHGSLSENYGAVWWELDLGYWVVRLCKT